MAEFKWVKWLAAIVLIVPILLLLVAGTSFVLSSKAQHNTSRQFVAKARQSLPEVETWITSLGPLKDGQVVRLPDELQNICAKHEVSVSKIGPDTWIVIECYVEGIDNGEGFAYCKNPSADADHNFIEEVAEIKRIDKHWVWFRFT